MTLLAWDGEVGDDKVRVLVGSRIWPAIFWGLWCWNCIAVVLALELLTLRVKFFKRLAKPRFR